MQSAGYVDQVKRQEEFRASHPEWEFISPAEPRSILRGEERFRALGPGGELVFGDDLEDLLDNLEKETAESGGRP